MSYERLNKEPITKERALDSAHRLIAAAFHRKDTERPRFCIPTQATDDDVTLTEYIDQQAERLQAIEADWVRRGEALEIAEKALRELNDAVREDIWDVGSTGFGPLIKQADNALTAISHETEQTAPQGEVRE